MYLKFSVVNVAEAFSKQVNSSVQQSFVEITERLSVFKKTVPIQFNYFTTNNILWT